MTESASILAYLGLSGFIKLSVNYLWRNRRPDNLEKAGHVTALYLYPVKSTKGISFKEIQVSAENAAYNGDIFDRQWMMYKDDVAVTMREVPELLLLEASIKEGNLVITSPDKKTVTVNPATVDKTGRRVSVTLTYGYHSKLNTFSGLDCGDEAAQFLSQYINKPAGYRLMYCSPTACKERAADRFPLFSSWHAEASDNDLVCMHHDLVSFQDLLPLSIIAEESLADLNNRLDKQVPVERFRPTIVLSSGHGPYSEDTWDEVYIGDVRLKAIMMWERCTVPNIDTETCKRDLFQPMNTIRSYRPHGIFGPYFGVTLVVQRPGTIRIGDHIYVTRGPELRYKKPTECRKA